MTFRPPLYLQNSALFSYAAADDRFLVDTLLSEGILNVPAGQGLAVQRPDGANMTVFVPPFDAVVKGDDDALQGSYLLRMVAAEFATVTAAPATNSRIDLLVAEVVDSSYRAITTANPEGPRLRVIAGTAAATPVVPTLPPTAIPLARIAVAAGQTSITTANITDLRPSAGAGGGAVGTAAQPLTAAQITALIAAQRYQGRLILNTTTGRLQHVVTPGAAAIDVAPPATAATATGSYTGDGSVGRTITVGFTAQLVLVSSPTGSSYFGWLHSTNNTLYQSQKTGSGSRGEYLTTNGFVVGNAENSPAGQSLNSSGIPYTWTAFKLT